MRIPSLVPLVVAAACAAAPALGATPPAPLTKTQVAKLQTIGQKYDALVKAGFADDPKTMAAMQADLKLIDAEKDPARKKAAIAAYQTRYAKLYKASLLKGKVDLATLAAELRSITGMPYVVRDGTHLVAHLTTPTQPAQPPAGPAKQTITLRGSDYRVEKQLGCGVVSGSSVVASGTTLTTDAWAAEAGGCANVGDMIHGFTVPADMTGRIEVEADLSAEASAVGVAGMALSSATAAVTVLDPNGNYAGHDNTHCSAAAPLLWAASESCSTDNAGFSAPLETGIPYRVDANVYTNTVAVGVVAATTAKARLSNLDVVITLDPR